MEELICDVSPFILKQKIYKVNLKTQDTELIDLCAFSDLTNTFIALGIKENIFNFHLCGDMKFITEIGNRIEEEFNLQYANNNIKVYYN